MTWADLVMRLLSYAQDLPVSAWRAYANPLLRWDVVTVVAGAYRVEVVRQRYGDFWRVQVLPGGASSWSAPLLRAEGPRLGCAVQQVTPGDWSAVVLTVLAPLPVTTY
jgi:hypothetical protein